MEFRMTTDLSTALKPQGITFNYEELKTALAEKLEKYKGLLVTEDGIAEAKKDRAMLRKVRDALNAEKVSVKKQWLTPYTDFENKVKELMEMCDAPAREIDEQIKNFENCKKQEKKEALQSFFNESIGEASEYVNFELIFDPKWLNATVQMEIAQEQIAEICGRYKEDTAALTGMCNDVEPSVAAAMKRAYRATRSLSNAISVKQEIERETELARKRKETEETRKAQEEQKKAENSFAVPENDHDCEQKREAAEENGAMVEVCFRVRCTKEQLNGLKNYIISNGIWYGRV